MHREFFDVKKDAFNMVALQVYLDTIITDRAEDEALAGNLNGVHL